MATDGGIGITKVGEEAELEGGVEGDGNCVGVNRAVERRATVGEGTTEVGEGEGLGVVLEADGKGVSASEAVVWKTTEGDGLQPAVRNHKLHSINTTLTVGLYGCRVIFPSSTT